MIAALAEARLLKVRESGSIQACDFVGYYVIYVNLSKMEVIYVIFSFRGYYVIFLKMWG